MPRRAKAVPRLGITAMCLGGPSDGWAIQSASGMSGHLTSFGPSAHFENNVCRWISFFKPAVAEQVAMDMLNWL
jgi:hypothetical protein